MGIGAILILVAVAAAAVLVASSDDRALPIVALVITGARALTLFGVLALHVRGVNLTLIYAVGTVIVGGVLWAHASAKLAITASTMLALVGLVQVLRFVL